MNPILYSMFLMAVLSMLAGCTTAAYNPALGSTPVYTALEKPSSDRDRMLIQRAWLSIQVTSVSDALDGIAEIARQSNGYVESQSSSEEKQADITLRVPADSLNPAIALLESIGEVIRHRISSEDVTTHYVDMDARLKTKIFLRDRLRALLDKALNVNDILAIEKELSRVQADIDSMEASLKALKGKVDLACIDVSVKRKPVLGPLGHVLKGTFWTIEKLFVIQE